MSEDGDLHEGPPLLGESFLDKPIADIFNFKLCQADFTDRNERWLFDDVSPF